MHLEDLLNTVYKLYENTKFFIAGAIGASIVVHYLGVKLLRCKQDKTKITICKGTL